MNLNNLNRTQKITVSGMMMALYIVAVYLTQGFAFGAYQIRIATALYAMAYVFPFLIIPMGLANGLSNILFGGMGPLDIFGGLLVGILTTALVVLIKKKGWNKAFVALPVLFVPGLGVATWLSYLLNIPYPAMALSLCIGQLIPAVCGVLLVKGVELYSRKVTAVQ